MSSVFVGSRRWTSVERCQVCEKKTGPCLITEKPKTSWKMCAVEVFSTSCRPQEKMCPERSTDHPAWPAQVWHIPPTDSPFWSGHWSIIFTRFSIFLLPSTADDALCYTKVCLEACNLYVYSKLKDHILTFRMEVNIFSSKLTCMCDPYSAVCGRGWVTSWLWRVKVICDQISINIFASTVASGTEFLWVWKLI